MSEYMGVRTNMDDRNEVVDVLVEDLGVDRNAIHVYDKPVVLDGYYKNRSATVVIKAGRTAGRYDIGFEEGKDGNLDALVEHMDHSQLARAIRGGKLLQCYAKKKLLKQLRKVRAKPNVETLSDGRIKIRATFD